MWLILFLCVSVARVTRPIPLADGRDQILTERELEIVRGREAPVGPRRRVVHVGRPRVDDLLPLRIDRVGDRGLRKRLEDEVANGTGGRIERTQVVRRAR